jgi:hypothetical protein
MKLVLKHNLTLSIKNEQCYICQLFYFLSHSRKKLYIRTVFYTDPDGYKCLIKSCLKHFVCDEIATNRIFFEMLDLSHVHVFW